MDTREINGFASAARSISLPTQPNYSSKPVQEALKHLASINLRELCNEAKVERCRATRDLASCGRFVNYVLNPCGHASLCTECCQRCDVCPICRSTLPKFGDRLRLRLYYECVEAGLISRTHEEASQDSDEDEHQLAADVHRLYSLFDVAMNNNLISVVCHYITNVCMDETAVSSDPVIAFLLDEVVVKDWVKRTFRSTLAELQEIYNLETKEMQAWLDKLLRCSKQVAGICSVLEVMESAFKGSVSPQLQDVQTLRENIGKTKQHLDIMVWCIRHGFLDDVRSRYSNFTSWNALVGERKSNAVKRAWPDAVDQSSDCSVQSASLFIEDALENLEREPEYSQEIGADLEVGRLQKDKRSFLRSKIEGTSGSYPFENLRTAADMLFLHGGSDLVVAKQAIFLYYLFDRHWTTPEKYWKHTIDDFAATFGITRHSLLESFVFYLLDDHSEEALQEACRILPEICGPETYPKVAQVLLERDNPETALMVLRWSGRDGVSELVSIGEAVTALRVRVECGLLSEAFTYQRTLCLKVKENNLKNGAVKHASDDLDIWSWTEWMEILVNEFCCLSIRRNLVDRIIELPWNPDEEKYLHRCLLDSATDDPSSAVGSLLVVFYLQRYRYIQAYQVDLRLQKIEEAFVSDNQIGEEVMFRMRSQSHWRKELVDRAIDILPVIQQQQVRSGQFSEMEDASEGAKKSDLPDAPDMITSSVPFATTNSVFLQSANNARAREPVANNGSPFQPGHMIGNASHDLSHGRLFTNANRGQKSEVRSVTKNLKFGEMSTPFKDLNRARGNSQLQGKRTEESSPEVNVDRYIENNMSSPYLRRITANNPVTVKSSSNHLNGSSQKPESTFFGTRMQPDKDNFVDLDDPMDMSSSLKDNNNNVLATESRNNSGGLRWRSDETSDDEDELTSFGSMPVKGRRRRRFAAGVFSFLLTSPCSCGGEIVRDMEAEKMELKLYNTMTQQKEVLIPITPGKIGLYVCGITAYDFSHIGHARAAVSFDVLYRYLKHLDYDVTFVRNFTDVDDKIIDRANKNGEDPLDLSNRFCDEYLVDMGALQCLPPTHQPRVSEHMDNIIKMIEKIIEKDCGYVVEGDVFFSVDKSPNYGKLSGQLLEHTRAGERVAVDSRKRNPADFALWKAAKPDEPSWESPWGPGRPGWHIECSAMSVHYLSPKFDIHGGGADLKFPHHENEIAQTCAACEDSGVNYWLHNGHVTINNEKMAKSKHNFKTIREITASYHPLALRHFLMSAQYRSPLSFTASQLESSSEALYYVYQTLQDLDEGLSPYQDALSEDGGKSEQTAEGKDIIKKLKTEFESKMLDDLNTAHILTGAYQDALKFINASLSKLKKMQKKQRMSMLVSLVEIEKAAREVLDVLGLLTTLSYAEILKEMKLKTLIRAEIGEEGISQLIEERITARKNKDFAKSDEIREKLTRKGIALMDIGKETVWRPCFPSQADSST